MAAKGNREKIKLESTAGTGTLLHHHEEQAHDAGKNADQEI